MTQWFKILIPAIIQASYDFLGWDRIIEKIKNQKQWMIILYRCIKEILDYPVTFVILYFHFHWQLNLIIPFYYAKIGGLCDAIYIVIWQLLNPKRYYPQTDIDWLWWSFPMGWIQTIILSLKEKKFTKGILTLKIFKIQVIINLILSFVIYFLFR